MYEYGSKLRVVHKNSRQADKGKIPTRKVNNDKIEINILESTPERKEIVEYSYKYLREKVNNVPLFGKSADIFFAYVHVTKKTFSPNPCAISDSDAFNISFTFEEKRVIHYHVPKEKLPQELKVISFIEQGEWSYSLNEEEYLELIDCKKTSDVDFITYRLNKRRLLYVIE